MNNRVRRGNGARVATCATDAEVYTQLVDQLYGTVGSFAAAVVASVLIAAVSYARTEHQIFLWCALPLATTSLLRVVVFFAHRRRQDAQRSLPEMRRWEAAYGAAALAWAFALGMTAYFGMLERDPVLQLYVTTLVVGTVGGMAGRNASRPLIVSGQLAAVLLPYGISLAQIGAPYYVGLTVLAIMLAVSVSSTTKTLNRILVQAMQAALRNKVLAAQFGAALNNMSHGLFMLDQTMKVVVFNNRLLDMLHLLGGQIWVGCSLKQVVDQAWAEDGASASDNFVRLTDRLSAETKATLVLDAAGGRVLEFRFQPFAGGSVIVVEDITERDAAAKKIERMAHYDELTDLPNRVLLRSRMEAAFSAMARGGPHFAILCVDLDQFKEVNDILGHPMGDKLLVQVGDRLRQVTGKPDFVARFGGDEFVVLQRPGEREDESACLAERLVEFISRPYRIDGHEINIGVSVGVSRSETGGASADDILKNADMALYKAKQAGRRTWCFFRPEMDQEAQRKRILGHELRQAIADESLTVFFQPIVSLADGAVTCCEALVRWLHPERGMIAPGEFIPVAEETGLISDLGGLVLRKACIEAAKWPSSVSVAVNLSALQFRRGEVVRQVNEALALSGLPARRLEVEITESLAMDNLNSAAQVIDRLRQLGVSVALDDFGTGQSSLNYLGMIEFDKVKIDRGFVLNLVHEEKKISEKAAALIKLVSEFVKSMDKKLVVEGVETAEQLAILRSLGVPEVQGFLFCKPRPGTEVLDLLRVNSKRKTKARGRVGLRVVA